MRTLYNILLIALVFAWLVPDSFAQCSSPNTVTIAYTWPPASAVGVNNYNVPSGPVSQAMNNWNLAWTSTCPPYLANGASNVNLDMDYASIPPPSNCSTCVTRGVTEVTGFANGRESSVQTTINNVITDANAITEVVAHEIGHTFALVDCNCSPDVNGNCTGCPLHSSVMVTGAKLPSVNSLEGLPGPNQCGTDVVAVQSVATDYFCSSGGGGCNVTETCQEGYAWNDTDCACEPATPIILDIDGRGFDLTSAAGGVVFDVSGTGHPVQISWTAPGSDNAFLCLPDSNGKCDTGKQLFGNFTPQPASRNRNGFAALGVYDQPANGGNGDGIIDSHDAIFSSLRLWIDANHDGISQPEELHTLPSLGVNSISLDYQLSWRRDQFGNVFRYRSQLNAGDPRNVGRFAYDVLLVIQSNTTTAKVNVCPAPATTRGMLSTGRLH